jgi:hypothetical protein
LDDGREELAVGPFDVEDEAGVEDEVGFRERPAEFLV